MKRISIILALLWTNASWAGNYYPPNNQGDDIDVTSKAYGGDADASSVGIGVGGDSTAIATGGDGGKAHAGSISDSQADASSYQSQGQQSTNINDQVTDVDVHSSTSTYNGSSATNGGSQGNSTTTAFLTSHRAIAVVLPSATAAPAVEEECLRHLAGWNPFNLGGRTGKTKYDQACLEIRKDHQDHIQCMDFATLYISIGRHDLALAALAECGGVVPQIDHTACEANDERIERVWQACNEK